MIDKRQANRDYQRIKYSEYKKLRKELLDKVDHQCYLCEQQYSERHLHFHHLEYHEEESDYKRKTNAQWLRWQRVKEAAANPDRFRVLCVACHSMITRLQLGRQVNWDKLPECMGNYQERGNVKT